MHHWNLVFNDFQAFCLKFSPMTIWLLLCFAARKPRLRELEQGSVSETVSTVARANSSEQGLESWWCNMTMMTGPPRTGSSGLTMDWTEIVWAMRTGWVAMMILLSSRLSFTTGWRGKVLRRRGELRRDNWWRRGGKVYNCYHELNHCLSCSEQCGDRRRRRRRRSSSGTSRKWRSSPGRRCLESKTWLLIKGSKQVTFWQAGQWSPDRGYQKEKVHRVSAWQVTNCKIKRHKWSQSQIVRISRHQV